MTIASRSVDWNTLTKKKDGSEIDLSGLSVRTLVNAGAGVAIGLSQVRFELLANLGENVAVRLRDATFGVLENLGGGGTRIEVTGGGFSSLSNRADGVALVQVTGASFGTVRNDGDRLGLLDVVVGAGAGTLLNDGNDTTIRFAGGPGDDLFVNDASCDGGHGTAVRLDVDLGAGADRAVIGGAGLTGRVAGGSGDDTYVFTGALGGRLSIDEASDTDADTLDFSHVTGGGIGIDIGTSRSQEIRPGFVLALSTGAGIENVVGTPGDDRIRGNGRGGVLLGADPADDRGGPAVSGPGRTQTVVLDFDARTDPGEHVYTPSERAAIAAGLGRLYDGFGVTFTTAPVAGVHATVFFNDSRADGTPGGQAGEIDFRNVDPGGTATVQVNGLLGLPGGPADSSDAWVAASVWTAAHETGHLLGLRHADSYGPVGFTTDRSAWGTNDHVIATPALTGFTLDDLVRDHFFGTREAVKLAFARYAPVVPDGRLLVAERPAATPDGLQHLSLVRLAVPNVATRGFEAATEPVVAAVAVTGTVSAPGQRDLFLFDGRAGDRLDLQVMSRGLTRLAGSAFDAVLEVRDAAGNVVAVSDDEAESTDPAILDLRLPADGSYVVEVRGYDAAATGDYELFAWRHDTASRTVGADTILPAVSPLAQAFPETRVPIHAVAWEPMPPRSGPAAVASVMTATVSGATMPRAVSADRPIGVVLPEVAATMRSTTAAVPSAVPAAVRGIPRGPVPRGVSSDRAAAGDGAAAEDGGGDATRVISG